MTKISKPTGHFAPMVPTSQSTALVSAPSRTQAPSKASSMAAPSAGINLSRLDEVSAARQNQPLMLTLLQQAQHQFITPHLMHEAANIIEQQYSVRTGEACDVLKPTPARRVEKETFLTGLMRACATSVPLETLSEANQALVHNIGAAFVGINADLWQHNTQDRISLFIRKCELQDFIGNLASESQRHSIDVIAGSLNAFKIAQASPLGLFAFAARMTAPAFDILCKVNLPPFWHAAHQLYDRCKAIVDQAKDTPTADTDASPNTQLLAARFYLQSVSGSSAPLEPLVFNLSDISNHIANWHLESVKQIPESLLKHPSLLALLHKIERNEVIDSAESKQVIRQLHHIAQAKLSEIQTQFNELTAHTPELKALIDQSAREAIARKVRMAEDEVKKIDSRPRDTFKSIEHYNDWMGRRQDRAEDAKFYRSGTYDAYTSAMGTLSETKTLREWLLHCRPAVAFVPEFINYGEADMIEGAGVFNSIKTHLLPEAVQSLGLNPELPRLIKDDIRRTQGLPPIDSPPPMIIEEIIEQKPGSPASAAQTTIADSIKKPHIQDERPLLLPQQKKSSSEAFEQLAVPERQQSTPRAKAKEAKALQKLQPSISARKAAVNAEQAQQTLEQLANLFNKTDAFPHESDNAEFGYQNILMHNRIAKLIHGANTPFIAEADQNSKIHTQETLSKDVVLPLLRDLLFHPDVDRCLSVSKNFCISKFLHDNIDDLERLIPNIRQEIVPFQGQERSVHSIVNKYADDRWSAAHLAECYQWLYPDEASDYPDIDDLAHFLLQEASEECSQIKMIDIYVNALICFADTYQESIDIATIDFTKSEKGRIEAQVNRIRKLCENLSAQASERTDETGDTFKLLRLKLKNTIHTGKHGLVWSRQMTSEQQDQGINQNSSIEKSIRSSIDYAIGYQLMPRSILKDEHTYKSELLRTVPAIQGHPLTLNQQQAINQRALDIKESQQSTP